MALEHDLTIIPILNKMDLPQADPERVAEEIEEIIEFCDPRIQGIKEAIEEAFGVKIDSHSLYFYGTKND